MNKDPDNKRNKEIYVYVIPRVFLMLFPFLVGILVNELWGLLVGVLFLTGYLSIIEGNLNKVFKWQK